MTNTDPQDSTRQKNKAAVALIIAAASVLKAHAAPSAAPSAAEVKPSSQAK